MEIVPGIHHFNTDPFNWYVIEDGGRLTLVDAGFPGHYRIFLEGIRSMGFDIRDVEAILITHAHADHTGFTEQVRQASNAPVFVHRADLASVGRVLQLPWRGLLSNAWRPFVASMLSRAIGANLLSMPRIGQAKPLEDGDVLDVPGRPHVFHVPGHTLGEVAFHLPERGVLLSGDALVTQDLMTGAFGQPQVTHRSLNDDHKMTQRSLDRLRELGQVTLLPGHGKPWVGSMSNAIEIARQSLAASPLTSGRISGLNC